MSTKLQKSSLKVFNIILETVKKVYYKMQKKEVLSHKTQNLPK